MIPTTFARPDGSIRQKPSSKIRRREENRQNHINEIDRRKDEDRSRFPRKYRNLPEKINLCILIVLLVIVVGALTLPFLAKPTYAQAAQDEISSEIFNSSYTQLEKNLAHNDVKVAAYAREGMREFWEQISNQRELQFPECTTGSLSCVNGNICRVDKEEEEVREIITLGAPANKLSNIQKQAEKDARLIMEELDPEEHGCIMGPHQSVRVRESNNLSQMLSRKLKPTSAGNQNLSQMRSQKLKHTSDDNTSRKGCRATKYSFSTNWQKVWVIALCIGVMAGLFAYKYVRYAAVRN